MKKYYVHNGTAQEGPFDSDDLKSKSILRSTPVWYEPLPTWTTAGEVDELKVLFVPLPPPFPTRTPAQNVAHEIADNNRAEPVKSGITLRVLLYAALIVVLATIAVYVFNRNKEQNKLVTETDARAAIRNNISSYVTASGSTYQYSTLGGISGLSITVVNNTSYMLDNVRVEVSYIKANGELWKNEEMDFPYLEGNHQITLPAPNSTRGTSVQFKITSIKSAALGL